MTKASRKVSSPNVINVEDLRRVARHRLPNVVFDYLEGAAEDEVTLQANRKAFEDVRVHQKGEPQWLAFSS